MGILQARIMQWVAISLSRGSSNPRIESRSPAVQVDSLPSEPRGKPKNTGVGSLSLIQGIFPTQESNWGLLHCRWILYQLNYQGSPSILLIIKRIHLQCRRSPFDSWVMKTRWRRDRLPTQVFLGFPHGSTDKQSACNVGDLGSIPG